MMHLQATRVLKNLIRYVKALQKDRIHIMNRYRRQLQSSPVDAEANRPRMVEHLAGSDRQLTAALSMLDQLSQYKDKIMKQIGELSEFRLSQCFLLSRPPCTGASPGSKNAG